MLSGAMDSLIVGDPADPRTDVGPVIDQPSYDKLMGRREAMKDRILKTVPVPEEGLFVPPTLIRIDAIEELRRSEEHTSELQSLMRISYAVFCLKKKK